MKVNLRTQSIEFFRYRADPYPPQPLYLTLQFLAGDLPNYETQKRFDNSLSALDIYLSGFGRPQAVFDEALRQRRSCVKDFVLAPR